MKFAVKIVAPLVLLLSAATATAAFAAPKAPYPTPDPKVDKNIASCKAERRAVGLAEIDVRTAQRTYDALRNAKNGVRPSEVWEAWRKLLEFQVTLSNANYDYAVCLNNKGNDPDKVCFEIANHLNKLQDELELRQAIFDSMSAEYTKLKSSGGLTELDKISMEGILDKLKKQIDYLKEDIKETQDLVDNTPACMGYPFTRPETKTELPPEGGPTSTATVTSPAEPTPTSVTAAPTVSASETPIPVP
jgi:hypothetical protein